MSRVPLLAGLCIMAAFPAVVSCIRTAGAGPAAPPDESAAAVAEPSDASEPAASTEPSDPPAPGLSDSPADDTDMIRVKNPRYNEKKPLLFDSGFMEDNSSCMVCHIDFEDELISSKHIKQGITCAACHGDSLTHSGDEFNIIRPDVIWGRAEIDDFCRQCHPKHKKPAAVEEFRAEWLSRRRPNGRMILKDSVCTDCHGEHAVVGEEGDFK